MEFQASDVRKMPSQTLGEFHRFMEECPEQIAALGLSPEAETEIPRECARRVAWQMRQGYRRAALHIHALGRLIAAIGDDDDDELEAERAREVLSLRWVEHEIARLSRAARGN